MFAPRITLPAIQHLSVSSGNDNRLKIGEKSPKPIGKETQIQKNENRQFIVDNRCKPNDLSLRLLKICFGSGKKYKGLIAFNFLGYVLYYIR